MSCYLVYFRFNNALKMRPNGDIPVLRIEDTKITGRFSGIFYA